MRNALVFILALFGTSLCLSAELYPSKPVRVIVNYGPGSSGDLTARVMTQQLSEKLGKSFVVENRQGASGTIGTGLVAKSAPDGYTLLLADTSVSMVPGLLRTLPFDLTKDLMPITQIVGSPSVLVVNSGLNVNTVKDFVALAQANPGKLNYGSSGAGSTSHLYSELFNKVAKTNIAHIPYKGGGGETIIALVGGHIQMIITGILPAQGQVKAGKVRALAVTTDGKRTPAMPEVPSMSEAGLAGMAVYNWAGLMAPAGTPKEVITKVHAEVVNALTVPSVRQQYVAQGAEVVGSSPEEFAIHLRNELQRWAEVIKFAGITPE